METTVLGKALPPSVLANLPGEADRTSPVNRNTGGFSQDVSQPRRPTKLQRVS